MKRTIIASLLVAALFVTSCYKDDSTGYQFDIPDVSIMSADGSVFYVGEESIFEPVIYWDGENPDDYDFIWMLNGKEKISSDKVLKYVFTETGEQYVSLQLKNKKTGIYYGSEFSFTVNTPFYLGWLVLSEGADKSSRLSYVNNSSFKSYPDVFATTYPSETLGKGPKKLRTHYISKTDEVLVLQDEGGAVELSGVTFAKVSDLEDEFIGEAYPTPDFKIKDVIYTMRGPELVVSDKGLMYERITASPTTASTTFQSAWFTTQNWIYTGGAYAVDNFPFPGSNTSLFVLFDGLNKRFIGYNTTTTIPYNIPLFVNSGCKFAAGMDYLAGMTANARLIYCQTYNDTSANKVYLACLWLVDGAYYMTTCYCTLSTTNYKVTVTSHTQKPLSDLSENGAYCLPRGASTEYANDPHLFYSVGNKLCFYHWSTGISYLYRDFSIDANAPKGDIVALEQNANATQIGVAFSDGKVFFCDIAKAKVITNIRQNNIDVTKRENGLVLGRVDNIPGTIVDLKFKYGKCANYTGAKMQ